MPLPGGYPSRDGDPRLFPSGTHGGRASRAARARNLADQIRPVRRGRRPAAAAVESPPLRSPSAPRAWRTVRRPRSAEHTSELQSLMRSTYAVFCLKKTKKETNKNNVQTEHYSNHPHNTTKKH